MVSILDEDKDRKNTRRNRQASRWQKTEAIVGGEGRRGEQDSLVVELLGRWRLEERIWECDRLTEVSEEVGFSSCRDIVAFYESFGFRVLATIRLGIGKVCVGPRPTGIADGS